MSIFASLSKKAGSWLLFSLVIAGVASWLGLAGEFDYRQFLYDNKELFAGLGTGLLIYGFTKKFIIAAFIALAVIFLLKLVVEI